MSNNVRVTTSSNTTPVLETNNIYYSSNNVSISDNYKDTRKVDSKEDLLLPYYLTSRQFFKVLETAFNDTYGSDGEWHPEDLYTNVECVLEVVTNTLSNTMRIKSGQTARGIKGEL